MITIVPCTNSDAAAVADFWNAKRAQPTSCWQSAPVGSPEMVLWLMALPIAQTFIAERSGTMVGIGLAHGPQLVSLGSADAEAHYALLRHWCQLNLDAGRTDGRCEVPADVTDESGWVDAIGPAIMQTPFGIDPETQAVKGVALTADFQTLANRLDELLGG
jgi:hypothetical protein